MTSNGMNRGRSAAEVDQLHRLEAEKPQEPDGKRRDGSEVSHIITYCPQKSMCSTDSIQQESDRSSNSFI